MLAGLNVLLGVTGGIACYKACEIVSRLRKAGAVVDVIMTDHACEFVTPTTFESLSGNPVISDMFARPAMWDPAHISLAKKADLCVIAPATADIVAKMAHGIADDMLSTTYLALNCPVLVVPAMNTRMYEHPATQANLAALKARGCRVMDACEGRLACGDVGKGKMPEPSQIVAELEAMTARGDYAGKRVLVTAGATRENVDGVRYLTNRSSGKMGIAIARAAMRRGAKVTLIAGLCSVPMPDGAEVVRAESTRQMYDAALARVADCDVIVKAAAPADYRVEREYGNKIKDETLDLHLVKNPDIAKAIGAVKGARKLVIFCAETQNLMQSARKKLVGKNADLVVANDVSRQDAGFDVDTDVAALISAKEEIELPLMSKTELADVILDKVLTL